MRKYTREKVVLWVSHQFVRRYSQLLSYNNFTTIFDQKASWNYIQNRDEQSVHGLHFDHAFL